MKKETMLTMVLFLAALWLFSTSIGFAQRSVASREYAQVYGFPPDLNQTGALMLNPHHSYFSQLPASSIKAVHGHLQHFAPARPDDDFPYEDLQKLEARQIAAGGPPIFVTATYEGKRRPVYFYLDLDLDSSGRPRGDRSWWCRAVNLRDEGFIQFFADAYVRKRMFQPPLQNYWLAVDNCMFLIRNYGVLDDENVYHSVDHFDPPFAQNDKDYLDSIVYFLSRLKQVAPDIHLMGNEGSMSDEARFSEVWAGFDGTMREDITQDFQPGSYYRDDVYTAYKRYQWEGPAGKVAILRALIPDDSSFQDKLRTAYMAYLIFRGPNFFFAPRFVDPPNGVPISAYSDVLLALGEPTGRASDQLYGANGHPGYRLYSRQTSHGIVYLNWSGQAVTVSLPKDKVYLDRNGQVITSLTIPDLGGDYVLFE
jgi:hypothetical protein